MREEQYTYEGRPVSADTLRAVEEISKIQGQADGLLDRVYQLRNSVRDRDDYLDAWSLFQRARRRRASAGTTAAYNPRELKITFTDAEGNEFELEGPISGSFGGDLGNPK